MSYICARCQIEMRVRKNGVGLVSRIADGSPQAVYSEDLWYCPDCQCEVVPHMNRREIDARWHDELHGTTFAERLKDRFERTVDYWLNKRERDQAASVIR